MKIYLASASPRRKELLKQVGISFRVMPSVVEEKIFAVQGTALKNVPAGYEKEHPQAQYLKFKSWYLEYPIKDEEVKDGEAFLTKAAEIFRVMKPFNEYLNRALAGFQMHAR